MLISSSVSTSNFTAFDALGRVTGSAQATGGVAYTFSYSYDSAGNLTQVRYPVSNRVVAYEYDGAGRVTAVRNGVGGPNYAGDATYAPHGAMAGLRLGNGLWESTLFSRLLKNLRDT